MTAFDAAVPERILSEERSAEAFEAAETADALDQAMAAHRGDADEWTGKAMTLLRAVQAADVAYKRELGEAFALYRHVATTGLEDDEQESDREDPGEPPTSDRR